MINFCISFACVCVRLKRVSLFLYLVSILTVRSFARSFVVCQSKRIEESIRLLNLCCCCCCKGKLFCQFFLATFFQPQLLLPFLLLTLIENEQQPRAEHWVCFFFVARFLLAASFAFSFDKCEQQQLEKRSSREKDKLLLLSFFLFCARDTTKKE